MKIRVFTILAAMALVSVVTVQSQELTREVTVGFDELPELPEYKKLNILPEIDLPKVSLAPMAYSVRQIRVGANPIIATMQPVAFADSIYASPYRGYAAVGFMPKFNLGASAGYKILDTDHTRLNAWLQYDGTAYKGRSLWLADKNYVRRNTATLGVNLHQAVGRESFIDAGVDYTFCRYNTFTLGLAEPTAPDYTRLLANQNTHRLNLSALWTMKHAGLDYGAGVSYGYFGYVNSLGYVDALSQRPGAPTRENNFRFNGFIMGQIAGASKAGIEVEVSHIATSGNSNPLVDEPMIEAAGNKHQTMVSLSPFYRLEGDRWHLNAGVDIDMTFNYGTAFHIAPNASATWLPGNFVSAYLKLSGGSVQNTLASLFDVTPYALPYVVYPNSHVPVVTELGVNIGRWIGFYAELSALYGFTSDWMMPVDVEGNLTMFEPVDMQGYRLRAALGYQWSDKVDFNASFEMAPQKHDRGYYQWRDRARQVVEASLTVRPIRALDVTLGWEYRGKRAVYGYEIDPTDGISLADYRIGLGSVNNLKVGALYQITEQFSAFLRGENLLNRKSLLIGGMPAQGATGLLGVTYKF